MIVSASSNISIRVEVEGNGMPSRRCSSSNQAAPSDRLRRPSEAWSMVIASAARTDGCRNVTPATRSPRRTRSVLPDSAASVVWPSKHSPGPDPYIGW